VTGVQLLRTFRHFARARKIELRIENGRGDHVRVWLGARRSELPGRRQEIRTGTLHAILKQLGVRADELKG